MFCFVHIDIKPAQSTMKLQLIVILTSIAAVYVLPVVAYPCANTEYVCPPTRECRSRVQRCTHSDNCTYPNNDDMCLYNIFGKGAYAIRVGYINLDNRGYMPRSLVHRFVQYRGFTYEYGLDDFGIKTLDLADPKYKYFHGFSSRTYKTVGYSYCNYEEVLKFASTWNDRKYNILFNNCIHFANVVVRFLTSNLCRGKKGKKFKRSLLKRRYAVKKSHILTETCANCTDHLFPVTQSQAMDKTVHITSNCIILIHIINFH